MTALNGMYIFFKILQEAAKKMPPRHIPHAPDIPKISSVLTRKIFHIIIIPEVLREL
jgi:hypothetical protein